MVNRTPSSGWDRPAVFRPGAELGPYVVVRRLGLGGMGEVYEDEGHLARLPDKRVALKVLYPEYANDPEVVKRFRREGEASARIRHPHVVRVENVGEEEGYPFLVMELLEGRDLRTFRSRARGRKRSSRRSSARRRGTPFLPSFRELVRPAPPASVLASLRRRPWSACGAPRARRTRVLSA